MPSILTKGIFYFADFLTAAHLFFCAAAILALASVLKTRFGLGFPLRAVFVLRPRDCEPPSNRFASSNRAISASIAESTLSLINRKSS
jgi:hypothetical protein